MTKSERNSNGNDDYFSFLHAVFTLVFGSLLSFIIDVGV